VGYYRLELTTLSIEVEAEFTGHELKITQGSISQGSTEPTLIQAFARDGSESNNEAMLQERFHVILWLMVPKRAE